MARRYNSYTHPEVFHAHKADPKEFMRRRDGISSACEPELFGTAGIEYPHPQKSLGWRGAKRSRKILAKFLAHAGAMMQHRIKVLAGDRVLVEMTPYDLTKGWIVYRSR